MQAIRSDAQQGARMRMRHLRWRDWWHILRGVVGQFSQDRVLSVAGGVTFFVLLALVPVLTTFVSIYGLFADPQTISQHIEMLARFLPGDVVGIVQGQIRHITATSSATLSATGILAALMALYSATGGMKAMIESLNLAWYQRETRGLIHLNLIGLAFTLGAIFLVLTTLGVITLLPAVTRWLHFPPELQNLIALARWPVLLAALTVAIAMLYRWAPASRNGKRPRAIPGAFVASVALVTASIGFSWYVANIAEYNRTYGSLGAIVVMMMWLWIASIIIMLGAELNSEVDRYLRRKNDGAD